MQTQTRTLTKLCRHIMVATITATLFISVGASADDTRVNISEERQRVQQVLNAYHGVQLKDLVAAANDPQAHLLEMLDETATRPLTRLQALAALAHFPNKATRSVYLDIIKKADHKDRGSRELHRAIQGLAFGFGEAAAEQIEPLLKHKDVQVRLTAVDAMSKLGAGAKVTLRDHLKTEKHPLVLESIIEKAPAVR